MKSASSPSIWTGGWAWTGIAVLALAVVASCGPSQSTYGLAQAEASIESARVHDADEYSPYEYARAEHYLYKAKQEWGYSNFEAARDYATEARRAADAALNNSLEAPWRGHPIYGFDGRPDDVDEMQEEMEEADDLDDVEFEEVDDTATD